MGMRMVCPWRGSKPIFAEYGVPALAGMMSVEAEEQRICWMDTSAVPRLRDGTPYLRHATSQGCGAKKVFEAGRFPLERRRNWTIIRVVVCSLNLDPALAGQVLTLPCS